MNMIKEALEGLLIHSAEEKISDSLNHARLNDMDDFVIGLKFEHF